MNDRIYDVIIIGGGPAGYTAALYTARAGLSTIVVEKFSAGGQMTQTDRIDNYPGFDEGIDGFSLGFKMQNGASRFGAETLSAEVTEVNLTDRIKTIITDSGILNGKTVIIATGADHKHLGIERERELIGKGVSYCASCDGMFFKDKTVSVVGGGNSAVSNALLLSKICKKVYLIHRRDELRATRVYHNSLLKAENIEFLWNSRIDKLLSDDKLTGILIENIKSGEKSNLPCDGLFISIGRTPETKLFEGQIDIDSSGYIVAGEDTKTNISGVFAVGDVRTKEVRQIVTAAADGATAAHFVEKYLASEF